ncbi:hypothetical protein Tcan_16778 [Toxocara canis]|uniref:Notch ligand N-terminal domain-containing protein n=1 Tax=Toxocara canis TaxID=6265 RepID=A0A0B2UXD5_TOXCA|nr:hypothetical protein Tcan_16778 [Toxocara canis]
MTIVLRSTQLSTIPSTTLTTLLLILSLVVVRTKAAGTLKFKLLEFETDGTLSDGTCCGGGSNGSKCVCEAFVHVCIGVGWEHRKHYRDCALIHHNSAIIARNKMIGIYAVNISFDVRWPLKNFDTGTRSASFCQSHTGTIILWTSLTRS